MTKRIHSVCHSGEGKPSAKSSTCMSNSGYNGLMIGVDLVYIPEFKTRLDAGGNAMLEKMFTLDELRDLRTDHLAGIWAAKEAVRKTMPEAPKHWTDISLHYDSKGKPSARHGQVRYDVSISHQGDYAVAIAQQLSDEESAA